MKRNDEKTSAKHPTSNKRMAPPPAPPPGYEETGSSFASSWRPATAPAGNAVRARPRTSFFLSRLCSIVPPTPVCAGRRARARNQSLNVMPAADPHLAPLTAVHDDQGAVVALHL